MAAMCHHFLVDIGWWPSPGGELRLAGVDCGGHAVTSNAHWQLPAL